MEYEERKKEEVEKRVNKGRRENDEIIRFKEED